MTEVLMPEAARRPKDIDQELTELAKLYRHANGPGLRFLTFVGAQADQLMARLPDPVRRNLDVASDQALRMALHHGSRRRVLPKVSPRGERLVGAALGAIGGAGGVTSTLVELPVTTAFLLRVIQQEAVRHGFDPQNESVQFDAIRIFGAPGPFAGGAGDAGYLAARLGLSGGGVQKLVAQVAPKLGIALGQKLAAQAVPVIGGAAGASCNYLYAGYYQTVAKVHFSVRRLAIDCDIAEADLMNRLHKNL